jgi:hypothetical protein
MKKAGILLLIIGLCLMIVAYLVVNPRTITPPYSYAVELFHPGTSPAPSLISELASFNPTTGKWFYYEKSPALSLLALGGGKSKQDETARKILDFSLGHRFFLVSPADALSEEMLASGRLPTLGENELIAGAGLEDIGDTIEIKGKKFKVVGRLSPAVRLFRNSVIALPSDDTDALFSGVKEKLYSSTVVKCFSRNELVEVARLIREKRGKDKADFSLFTYDKPYAGITFFVGYLGYFLLLIGGVVLIFGILCALKEKLKSPALLPGLEAVCSHRRLYFWLNGIYFGLAILTGLFIYFSPAVQFMLINMVGVQISSGEGILGWVGRAYAAGNIPYAAFATFTVNSLLGTLAYITLPSFVIPGIGLVTGFVRGALWGLLLTPASEGMARSMIPHSITAIIEGEAYVLAMIYVFLMAAEVYKGKGDLKTRYYRGMVKNLYGFLWVLIFLAVAAIYEASEIILLR